MTFGYNAEHRTSVTDASGALNYAYDDAGRLTSQTLTGAGEFKQARGYNDRNELTGETRYSDAAGTVLVGTTTRGHDDAGNLTNLHYQNATGATISNYVNVYDNANRITSETINGGAAVRELWDASISVADRPTCVSSDAGKRQLI